MPDRPKPRKTPVQSRSRATCDAILEAAARILEVGGLTALTTNEVARRAGVSIGSLYQYFPDKQAILAELIRNMRAEMQADFSDASQRALATPNLGEAIDILIAASLRHHLNRPVLAERLEEAERDLPLDAETARLKSALRDSVASVLARHGIPMPDQTAFDLIAIAQGLSDAAIRAGERDFAALQNRLHRAVSGYLSAE
jgi:AcrR family transcriptional regulator